ncbi:Vacuolar protein sorting-associated protein 41 [Thoreauomyces humboldtii]|nr:Vacuolar protein sorting-associated protein 41 [Thoreauomyces humboldtii]
MSPTPPPPTRPSHVLIAPERRPTEHELQMETVDSPTGGDGTSTDDLQATAKQKLAIEAALLSSEFAGGAEPGENVVERALDLPPVSFRKVKSAETLEASPSVEGLDSGSPEDEIAVSGQTDTLASVQERGEAVRPDASASPTSEDSESEEETEESEESTDEEEEDDEEDAEDEQEVGGDDKVGVSDTAKDLAHPEDEDDVEEEEEPKLKYQRLASTLGETLKKDAVSTMAVSDRFLALGTHWGIVHILDLIGTDVKRFQSHSATVNALSIDSNGEFVASASDDGKVVINSLYSTEVQMVNYKRPVKAISLEPDYSRKTTRQFVSGGMAEVLTMTGKGWFGNKDITISSGEGPIYAAQWRGNFIAWANEAGVKIYDVTTQQKIAYVDRPPNSPRADLFRCNLVWTSDYQLLMGWADSVKLCVIKERSKMDVSSGLPSRYVEILCQFRTDFIVSGIAPLDQDIVLLSYMTDIAASKNVDVIQSGPARRAKSKPPEIHIVTRLGQSVATDVLSLVGFEHYNANDYRLGAIPEYLPAENPAENTFYIVSPKDIVVAKPRSIDDHVEWLVERKRYEEALAAAESAGSGQERRQSQVNTIVDIGQKYMETLMLEDRFEDTAALCPKILRSDSTLWETWIRKFAKEQQLMAVHPFIPTTEPQLATEIYDMVLTFLLNNDLKAFHETVTRWPPSVFNITQMITDIERMLKADQTNESLKEIAINRNHKQHDRELYYALVLRQPDALDLVATYNLYAFVQDHALIVLEYDDNVVSTDPEVKARVAQAVLDGSATEDSLGDIGGNAVLGRVRAAVQQKGVQILVHHPDRVSARIVVDQLSKRPKFLHIFLDAVFKKDPLEGVEFHPMQVALYAEYDYLRLMEFLRVSSSYSVQKAYDICEVRDLVPEMVFLLGKMGDNRRALNLIIERLGDVKRAIDFAKEQNDEELWEDLLKYSMDKPSFIVGLLENLGSHINPIRVVEKIPNGLEIQGLKEALIKIMTDYGIQMSLREGCEKILISDTVNLLETLYRAQRRGLTFTDDITCSLCGIQLERKANVDMIIFFCRHSYHEQCLGPPGTGTSGSGQQASPISPTLLSGSGSLPLSTVTEDAIRRVYERHGAASGGVGAIGSSPRPVAGIAATSRGKVLTVRAKRTGALSCPICRNTKKKGSGVRAGLKGQPQDAVRS